MRTILLVDFQETVIPRVPIIRLQKEIDYLVFPHMMLKRELIHDHVWSVELREDGIYYARIQNCIIPSGPQANGKLFDQMINNGWTIHKP